MLIMVIYNTKFRCTLIAMNFQTKNVSVVYAKYGDYGNSISSFFLFQLNILKHNLKYKIVAVKFDNSSVTPG